MFFGVSDTFELTNIIHMVINTNIAFSFRFRKIKIINTFNHMNKSLSNIQKIENNLFNYES